MEKLRIYLAGYTLQKEYRRIVHEKYDSDFDILDPLLLVPQNHDKLPSLDKSLIISSDILVAYITQPSWGTAMEIIFAYDHNKLVVIIDPTEQIRKDKWVKFHCYRFFNSIEECFETLKIRDLNSWLGEENG